MSHPRMIPLTIEEHEWRPARDDDPTRSHLTGPTITINGLPLHVEAWRVSVDGYGTQEATDAAMERDFSDLYNAVHGEGHFMTTKIGEFNYIIIATPYCD